VMDLLLQMLERDFRFFHRWSLGLTIAIVQSLTLVLSTLRPVAIPRRGELHAHARPVRRAWCHIKCASVVMASGRERRILAALLPPRPVCGERIEVRGKPVAPF